MGQCPFARQAGVLSQRKDIDLIDGYMQIDGALKAEAVDFRLSQNRQTCRRKSAPASMCRHALAEMSACVQNGMYFAVQHHKNVFHPDRRRM
ncbi:hypothetical protein MPC4_10470 [Methylocella tundrae]|uniref:Uncharacterized protein n=1 Tax=Methylocella tundrae TaxID=227605 RepID=A0A8B6M1B6_METTU|nr:hypothetical protein MPC1_210015 [Methylocella tundrae]VTZ48515.1 hypothetical protein MPC4_10470 [Methylocella tundrae]